MNEGERCEVEPQLSADIRLNLNGWEFFSFPILGGKDTSSAQLEDLSFTLFGSGINDGLLQKDFQLSKKEVKYLKAKFGPKI